MPMNKIVCLAGLLLMNIAAHAQNDISVMTFNIRYNSPGDSLNAWAYRKDKVASEVLFHKIDLLGVQEALVDQVSDLEILLNDYSYTGVGRDDGKKGGEYSAIFYNKKRFELAKSSTFWLSETPAVPGKKGWDAV